MKIALVSGGSGGHLIPALALAESLQKNGMPCQMISTARPMDRQIAQMADLPWETVPLEKITPLYRWLQPSYARRQWSAWRRLNELLDAKKPDLIVGFGGYLSALAAWAANRRGIKVILHEQNLIPGQGNRWSARFSDAVAVSFPETRRYFSSSARVCVTGNPLRHDPASVSFEVARSFFGFDSHRPVLLAMGGSQGARRLNEALLGIWEIVPADLRSQWQVIHLTGPADSAAAQAAYSRLRMQAKVYPFLEQMPFALKAATLAVSRAGATGLAEMAAFRLPSILIPYPHAGGHQRANAVWMESAGGAIVLEETQLTSDALAVLFRTVTSDPSRLVQMRESLAKIKLGAAGENWLPLIREIVA